MVLVTWDYGTLTDNIYSIKEVFNDAMADQVNEAMGLTIFDVEDTKTKNDRLELNHGLSGVKRIAENEDYPEATGEQGDNITLTKYKYGANVVITKEDILYDKWNQIRDNIPSIVEEGMSKLDRSLADVLMNGFATSYTNIWGDSVSSVWPDAAALFDDGHTNGTTSATYNNIITDGTNVNPSLEWNRDALTATKATGLKYADPNGVKRRIMFDTLLIPADLEDAAHRLCRSQYIPGSSNNDTNKVVIEMVKNIKVWDKLDATGNASTDRSGYRYMYDSKKIKRTLRCFFSQRPDLSDPKQFDPNHNNNFLFDFLYSYGFSRNPYIMGSKGTNAA